MNFSSFVANSPAFAACIVGQHVCNNVKRNKRTTVELIFSDATGMSSDRGRVAKLLGRCGLNLLSLFLTVWGRDLKSVVYYVLLGDKACNFEVKFHYFPIYNNRDFILFDHLRIKRPKIKDANVASHRQDSTYHGLCYTSRGALVGTRNSLVCSILGYIM